MKLKESVRVLLNRLLKVKKLLLDVPLSSEIIFKTEINIFIIRKDLNGFLLKVLEHNSKYLK